MADAARRQPIYRSLYFQVLVAIALGVLLGVLAPATGAAMKPLGDGFVKLVRMIIAPVIFCTVVTGIAGMQSMKQVGKAGGLALLYFEVVSTLALVVGLLVINLARPGAGMHVRVGSLDAGAVANYTRPGQMQGPTDFLLHVIPGSLVGAFAEGEILQVLLVAVLFGFALHRLGERGKPLLHLIDQTALIGPVARITDRLAAYAEAEVHTLAVTPGGDTLDQRMHTLRTVAEAMSGSRLGE